MNQTVAERGQDPAVTQLMDQQSAAASAPTLSARAKRLRIPLGVLALSVLLGLIGLPKRPSLGTELPESEAKGVENSASKLLKEVVKELGMLRTASLNPDPIGTWGTSSLQFRQLESYTADGVVWSSLRRIEWRPAEGESSNGLDDNANGLVDEGQVVLIRDDGGVGEHMSTLGADVAKYLEAEKANGLDDNHNGLIDEKGLSFVRKDNTLVVRITTMAMGELGTFEPNTSAAIVRLEM